VIVNPGSVGYSKDRVPMPCYVIMDVKRMTFEFRRVPIPENTVAQLLPSYEAVIEEVGQGKYRYNGITPKKAQDEIRNLYTQMHEARLPIADPVSKLPRDWIEFYKLRGNTQKALERSEWE
jgi:hypothetical protein